MSDIRHRFDNSPSMRVLPYAHKKMIPHKNSIRSAVITASIALLTLFLLATATRAQEPSNPNAPPSERHEFVISNFKTESGVTLPQARIVYGTYGHLNAAKDNVILMPSHYMADYHGYEWLIGEKLALDPEKLFLVTTEMFGSGHSSSPSNTPEPFHGPRFPVTTIRDNVEAVHHLLVDELKVTHLRSLVFRWAPSKPSSGPSAIPRSPIASSPRPAPRSATRKASFASKARSTPSNSIQPSTMATTQNSPPKASKPSP